MRAWRCELAVEAQTRGVRRATGAFSALLDVWLWAIAAGSAIVIVLACAVGAGMLPRSAIPATLPAAVPPVLASIPTATDATQAAQWLATEGQRAWEVLRVSLTGRRGCRTVLGFGKLETVVGRAVAGDCLENERTDPVWGVAIQETTRGLFVYRRADGTLAFTDGYHTWLIGPAGLQRRLNNQRLCWEPDAPPRTCLRN